MKNQQARIKECGELRTKGQRVVREALTEVTSKGCGTQARQVAKVLARSNVIPEAKLDEVTYALRAFAEHRESLIERRGKLSAADLKAIARVEELRKEGLV